MIERYSRPEMKRIWSDENKFNKWLDVEIATCDAWAEIGNIPRNAIGKIKLAKCNVKRMEEILKETHHDMTAFLGAVSESLGDESRYIHMGLTSSDVMDTALSLQMAEATDILLRDIKDLIAVLAHRAIENKYTQMIGRTHGVHAEPITFGLKLAIWIEEVRRNQHRLAEARRNIAVGKISGAVGTFAHVGPEVEEAICAKLGLKPAAISSQVIQRDRHAYYISTLAVIAASLEKIALEIRSLQRTEVREAEEYFSAGQKGSSAMPHKRNPVGCEQICGLSRVVRANAQAALENVALWHERDISHSSVERVILPDSTVLTDYLLDRTRRTIDKLLVYPERMRANLEMTRGLIFSGQLLLDLAAKGVLREEAYQWVQRNAMRAWEKGEDFRQLVEADPDISHALTPAELDAAFDLKRQLRHVDAIFHRVFGGF